MHLVAVYGSLKKDYHNHVYLKGADLLGTFKTEPVYTLVSLGSYPALKRGGKTEITYELYNVKRDSQLKDIYALEGYHGTPGHPNNWYDVDKIKTPHGEAELFVMGADKYPNAQIIESGNW
jgi:gamma-glutamylcyclotransferase (GGCT)/AIG2-like uncharacterized protein YtfP